MENGPINQIDADGHSFADNDGLRAAPGSSGIGGVGFGGVNPFELNNHTVFATYIIIHTVGNPSGDDDFRRAAVTRADEIMASPAFDPKKDIVLVYAVQTKDNFKWALSDAAAKQQTYGSVEQLAIFSHGGQQFGTIFHDAKGHEEQFSKSEMANLQIHFSPTARADFMMCHAATNGYAQSFADAHNVKTRAFGDTVFSGSPNEKTYGYLHGGPEYLLGSGGGWFARHFWGTSPVPPQPFLPKASHP